MNLIERFDLFACADSNEEGFLIEILDNASIFSASKLMSNDPDRYVQETYHKMA